MAKLCIPSPTVEKMKQALISGDLSLEKLYDMPSSEARRKEFRRFLPEGLAEFVNLKFEAAAASNNRNALKNFVKEIATPKEVKKGKTANILTRIKKLKDADLLNTESQISTFTDLVSARLGVEVTPEEIKTITEKADDIESLKDKVVEVEAESYDSAKAWRAAVQPVKIEYRKAVGDMDKFLNAQTPTHLLKVITGSIFRGNMLLNIPPAMVNTISNIVQGVVTALERRIASRTLRGLNNDYAIEYFKMNTSIFHQTGFDESRQYAENIRLGEHLVHNEGPGIIRKAGRGQAKIVFKYLLGYSDVVSAGAARADSSNVGAAKIAKAKGLKGKEAKQYAQDVFVESVKITSDVTTDIGKDAFFTNTQAISDAERSTWTNKGFFAKKAIQFRDWLNDLSGDLQIGFWHIPFIKTGANVVQVGIESSPIGGIVALAKLNSAIKTMKDPVLSINERKAPIREVIRLATRSGLGWILSMILVGLFDPDDFFGGYDAITQKQRDQMGLKKGVYNAIQIGDTWVSLDFFGPLGATMVGMMYAKKYGEGPVDTIFKFAQGVGQQTLQVPGIDNFEELIDSWRDILTADTLKEGAEDAAIAAVNQIRSRAIPGILGTIAKATDIKARKIDRKEFFSRLKAGIPGLRQKLPAKIDITTGKEVKGEGFWINLLFGSRVKTANESALIDEITRLDAKGQAPAIADIERSSTQVQALKTQISGTLFQEALKWFGREYGRRASETLFTGDYFRATDEEKKEMLNKIRDQVREATLKKFHFRKKRGRK